MKKLLIVFLILFGLLLLTSPIQAQRAECDACGYCVNRTPPENWNSCRACLYPSASEDYSSNQTLELARNAQGKMEPVKKVPGTYYTQLGCLNVGAGSFSDPTAPGGVLNFLLSSLIFPVVGVLSFISLIYGSFLLITAQGVPEQISRGKSYMVGAIVGLLFTLSAILIINILAGDILRIPGFTRSSKLRIMASSTSAKDSAGVVSYPQMNVYVNDELKDSFTVSNPRSDVKEYIIPLPNNIQTAINIKVEFPNDFNPPEINPETGPYGDRNLFIKDVLYDEIPCVLNGYFYSGILHPKAYQVEMWYNGYVSCTITP